MQRQYQYYNKELYLEFKCNFQSNKEKITKLSGGDSDVLNNGDTGYALALGEAINSLL